MNKRIKISWRKSTGAVALIAVSGLVAACGSSGGDEQMKLDAKQTITYVGFGGALQEAETKAWFEPFMKKHPNITIQYDTTDYAKLKAMVERKKVTWDVFNSGSDFGLGKDEQYLTKLDCDIIPCADLQPDVLGHTDYRVPATTSGLAIGYNKDKMPAGQVPQNWQDFFDVKKFPGKRVIMLDTSSFPFEQALLGAGVAPDALYPIDFAKAIAKLDSIGKDIKVAASYQACGDMVGSGEAVMGACWTGRLVDQIDAGRPVGIQWQQNILSPGYLSIPKGSKHAPAATELIAYIENNAAELAKYIPYGPVNTKQIPQVQESRKPFLQSTYADQGVPTDDKWLSDNAAEYSQKWEAWKSGS
jgi:putative spermidine/putrescine transport system substrate-binding protein